MYWRPRVLTPENPDPSAPKMTMVEAESLFLQLLERGLIYRSIEMDGPAFRLHESKVCEWEAFIASHSPSRDQRSPDDNASQEGYDNGNGQRGGIYELLGGVIFFALGSGFTEIEYHKCAIVCYYLSVQFGLAAALHYLKKSYRYAKNGFWILTVLILAVFAFLYFRASQSIPAPSQAPAQKDPFIEGTEYTQRQLSDVFPFGYAVFFYGQNMILQKKIFKNGIMDWTLDVDKVSIEPNFATGMVTWTIPGISATTDASTPNHGGNSVYIHGDTIGYTTPIRRGFAEPAAGLYYGNQPVPYVVTLSDNQRSPVFALGFRIPPKPPPKHKAPIQP